MKSTTINKNETFSNLKVTKEFDINIDQHREFFDLFKSVHVKLVYDVLCIRFHPI